ncbi:hypothetical protein BLS_005012 [Venturia inaequalis]|uniref:Uncharacterized protein n=1 Tax=Venturia inaequalis TaxID=5025 RepID=A0A8H3YSD6_VENIN|nr:hypothetical protein BLS_005012 [Venturia inaequalis]
MVKDCESMTSGGLQMVHAFYIGMLALRYRTELGERVIWPNQYRWLLEQRIVEWRDHTSWGLSQENIKDKSNADWNVKLFAFLQVSWFVAQSIMRTTHNLPLAQLETMTLSYVPLFAVTLFFWWTKPKDILYPSVIDLPEMCAEQKTVFESMAVSNDFDEENLGKQGSIWAIWTLTPRVFEKEAKDKAMQEMQQAHEQRSEHIRDAMQQFEHERSSRKQSEQETASVRRSEDTKASNLTTEDNVDISQVELRQSERILRRMATGLTTRHFADHVGHENFRKCDPVTPAYPEEIILGYWDPSVYHSKLWPVTCLFGASFGALHLISWHTQFPTVFEQWLWQAAAITSIFSMLIFMQYEKVVLRWGGPLTLIGIASPVVYLLSRIVMIGGVFAAFRAMDPRIYDVYVVSNYWVHLV